MGITLQESSAFSRNNSATETASESAGMMADFAGGALRTDNSADSLRIAESGLNGDWTGVLGGDPGVLPTAARSLARTLPPELSRLIGSAEPLLTEGLSGLLSGDGFSGLGGMMSLGGMMGLAGQFLPPWAGDAMAVGNELVNNFPSDISDLAGSVENLAGRFLPPELQAAWGAIQQAGGIQGLLADVFDEPKSPQSPPGPWAARLTDIAACPGGAGPIAAPCLPTVLIGGFPAARRSDVVICNGLPIDSIAIGEPTVLMGGLFAARRDDQTAHQGKIETGFPTVHIGKKRSQAGIQKAIQCAAEAADAGAATISGSGITGPLTDGAFGGLGDIFKDAAAGALGDFAKEKIGGLVSDKVGEAISNVFEDSEKPKVKPQPKLVDDEFGTTKRN